jgi:hypothetical protein
MENIENRRGGTTSSSRKYAIARTNSVKRKTEKREIERRNYIALIIECEILLFYPALLSG